MKIRKRRTIKVAWEGFLYLSKEQHRQRCESGKPFSERAIKSLERSFELTGGILHDGDRGGCVGNPVNAWEEGRWTDWSVEDMKRMLDEKGFEWEDAGERESIEIGI